MKRLWYAASTAAIAFASARLFEWDGDTALHVLTGVVAGILVMSAIDDWKGPGRGHGPR